MTDPPVVEPSAEAAEPNGTAARVWRTLQRPPALRALLTIAAGIAMLVWPGRTLPIIVGLAGIAVASVGLIDLRTRLRTPPRSAGPIVQAVVTFLAGTIMAVYRRAALNTIATVIGVALVIRGATDLVTVWQRWRRGSRDVFWPALRGGVQLSLVVAMVLIPETVLGAIGLSLAAAWISVGAIALVRALNPDEDDDLVGGLAKAPEDLLGWLRSRDMTAAERSAVTEKIVFAGPALTRRVWRFVALMAFSTVIATLGVRADSTAVVIGAMLIAPLMTPIMGTAASLIMGWPGRATRSALLVALGVGLAVGGSWLLAASTPEIVAIDINGQVLGRVAPTLLDLLIAVAAGAAGAYAISRPDVSDSLPGVAIAVALVPPLTVVGVALADGEAGFAAGALLLFTTNLVAILFAAGTVFVLVGYSPWFHVETPTETLKRSAATVAAAIAIIAVPLGITGEDIVRSATADQAAADTVDEWLGTDSGFRSARVDITRDEVTVVIIGIGDTPPVDELAGSLAVALDQRVELELQVIPETTFRATGEP